MLWVECVCMSISLPVMSVAIFVYSVAIANKLIPHKNTSVCILHRKVDLYCPIFIFEAK